MNTVLLTGGTGALGKFFVQELLSYEDTRLILLVRAVSDIEARKRVESFSPLPKNVEVFAADLEEQTLNLSDTRYQNLASRVTHILHSAASTRFNSTLEEARRHNVETTEHMLTFAKQCTNLVRFGHISTAMVSGKRIGLIKEAEFEHDEGFSNTYQQSKYEAEALVRASELPFVIFRPPFVSSPIDTSLVGALPSFLSHLVTLVVAGHIPFIPGTKESAMDIVSSSDAIKIICRLFLKHVLSHTTYHITNGANELTVGLFHTMMEEESGAVIPIEYLGDGDAGMRCVREKAKADPRLHIIYKRAESFLVEPGYPKVFDNINTLTELNLKRIGINPVEILRSVVHDVIWNSSK